jgi:type II secretory pathway component PulF
MNSYVYTGALSGTGHVRGVVEAENLDHARAILASMRITPVELQPAPAPRTLSTDDLYALNQQLILMVDSGMPLEPGLRLLAQDVRDKRLAGTLELIARETEAGLPLVDAFAKHQALFPVMYSQIVAGGLARGDLSLTLTDLSRRMEFQERVRKSLWRALTYPAFVLLGFFLVAHLISSRILPVILKMHHETFQDWGSQAPLLPWVTRSLNTAGPALPWVGIGIAIAIVLVYFAWKNALRTGRDSAFLETWIAPLPVVGQVVKSDLTARWCAAVHHGLAGSRPLPEVLASASQVVGSDTLKDDSQTLIDAITHPTPDLTPPKTKWLDLTVVETLRTANQSGRIADQAKSLADHYLKMAEYQAATAASVLTPFLLAALALLLGWLLAAVYAPLGHMVNIMQHATKLT